MRVAGLLVAVEWMTTNVVQIVLDEDIYPIFLQLILSQAYKK